MAVLWKRSSFIGGIGDVAGRKDFPRTHSVKCKQTRVFTVPGYRVKGYVLSDCDMTQSCLGVGGN